jgi:hypothetical protein
MEDYKWVIYVIAALYFILKSRKKKSPPESEGKPFELPDTSTKPVTFEDLLREIQSTKTVAPPEPKPAPYQSKSYPTYEDYDDNIGKEEKDLEEVDYNYRNQDKIYETYEKAKQAAFNRPSLEETMKVEDTVVRFGHFKEYDQQAPPSLASTLGKDLQDPENFKKAFILSEILTRKY